MISYQISEDSEAGCCCTIPTLFSLSYYYVILHLTGHSTLLQDLNTQKGHVAGSTIIGAIVLSYCTVNWEKENSHYWSNSEFHSDFTYSLFNCNTPKVIFLIWSDTVLQQKFTWTRPCLTINKEPSFFLVFHFLLFLSSLKGNQWAAT